MHDSTGSDGGGLTAKVRETLEDAQLRNLKTQLEFVLEYPTHEHAPTALQWAAEAQRILAEAKE